MNIVSGASQLESTANRHSHRECELSEISSVLTPTKNDLVSRRRPPGVGQERREKGRRRGPCIYRLRLFDVAQVLDFYCLFGTARQSTPAVSVIPVTNVSGG
jgi:hypothetical protein